MRNLHEKESKKIKQQTSKRRKVLCANPAFFSPFVADKEEFLPLS
jgi:hypothetical protein